MTPELSHDKRNCPHDKTKEIPLNHGKFKRESTEMEGVALMVTKRKVANDVLI